MHLVCSIQILFSDGKTTSFLCGQFMKWVSEWRGCDGAWLIHHWLLPISKPHSVQRNLLRPFAATLPLACRCPMLLGNVAATQTPESKKQAKLKSKERGWTWGFLGHALLLTEKLHWVQRDFLSGKSAQKGEEVALGNGQKLKENEAGGVEDDTIWLWALQRNLRQSKKPHMPNTPRRIKRFPYRNNYEEWQVLKNI